MVSRPSRPVIRQARRHAAPTFFRATIGTTDARSTRPADGLIVRVATAATSKCRSGPGAARTPARTAARSIRSGTALIDATAGGMLELEVVAPAGARGSLDIARLELPPRLRPGAGVGVLDITEFFGDTTGGVRTYLLQKARYVQRRPELRQAIVVPGARDEILEADGVRCYRLHGPAVPTQ